VSNSPSVLWVGAHSPRVRLVREPLTPNLLPASGEREKKTVTAC
jgi:hypothetical protein